MAIVTGAAQGIGATYAKALAQEGACVMVADNVDGREIASKICGNGLAHARPSNLTALIRDVNPSRPNFSNNAAWQELDQLRHDGIEKRLDHRFVVTIHAPAHRDQDATISEQRLVVDRAVLGGFNRSSQHR